MTINAQFVTTEGKLSSEWKKDEQFHIFAKTVVNNQSMDLVFLSGYAVPTGWVVNANEWLRDTLVFKFDDIRWNKDVDVRVVPLVTPATFSNTDTKETDIVGWGVDYTTYELRPGPAATQFKTIWMISNLAICGMETFLNRVAYSVVAIGKLTK